MARSSSSVAVLGDGGWGTTLAVHLHRGGHRVIWWSAFPEHAKRLDRFRENSQFLPGIRIPKSLHITADLAAAVEPSRVVIFAIPSQYLRLVVHRVSTFVLPRQVFVSVAKGLETKSLKRMSEVIAEELGRVPLAVLSGPNIAAEIARGQPASSVAASHHPGLTPEIQALFMSQQLRIYTSNDVAGVELGGALKNPIAIAAGIGDGLGFGANAKAGLITRGVVEMARLGVAMGGQRETFWGLSGLGDLITTCLGGRNRWLGEQIGRGKSPAAVLAKLSVVIEGVETSKAAVALAHRHRVELPIIEQVHAVLFRHKRPRAALQALMTRSRKAESPPFFSVQRRS